MNFKNAIIIFIIIILLYFFSINTLLSHEHLQNITNNTIVNDDKKKYSTIYSESIQLLDDPLFSDVILYNNDPDPYKNGQKSGLQKCFDNCNGVCVEFGISGIAYCFPHSIN